MLVGTLLSAHALGLYRVAKSFGGIVGQLQDPLMHAVYPELARRFAARDSAGFADTLRATARLTFVAGPAVFAGFYFGADLLLLLSAGPGVFGGEGDADRLCRGAVLPVHVFLRQLRHARAR